jgi:hypothetical protein
MNFKKVVSTALLLTTFVVPFAASAQEDKSSTNAVYEMADGSEIPGSWSTVRAFDNGVMASLHTANLEPGSAYTVWWVIFNDPANCSNGVCNMDDIFVVDENGVPIRDESLQRVLDFEALERAQVSIQYATGGYVRDSGEASVAASLGVGSVPGIVVGPGLVDPYESEVHLVVRTHGPKIDELFDDQILTFGGGCDPIDAPPCDDIQFSFHSPLAQ